MKKLLLLSLFVSNLMAMSSSQYAQLYSDKLLKDFDQYLNDKFYTQSHTNILNNQIYFELLASRDLIEHSHEDNSELITFNKRDLLSTIKAIKKSASIIKLDFQKIKSTDNNIYPSVTSSGNLTGNTFPKNVWSITFDDGPHPSRTSKTVDNYYGAGVKATYFMLTEKAKSLTHIMDYVLDSNMEIALHSYSHKNLSSTSRTQTELEYEINTAKIDLERISKRDINLFRLPYGAGMRKTSLRSRIAKAGLIHVFWNVDTLDWKDKDPQSILDRSLKQMMLTPKRGGIILFHDIHNQSVIASRLLLDVIQDRGYTVCTIGEMVNFFNNKDQDCL